LEKRKSVKKALPKKKRYTECTKEGRNKNKEEENKDTEKNKVKEEASEGR